MCACSKCRMCVCVCSSASFVYELKLHNLPHRQNVHAHTLVKSCSKPGKPSQEKENEGSMHLPAPLLTPPNMITNTQSPTRTHARTHAPTRAHTCTHTPPHTYKHTMSCSKSGRPSPEIADVGTTLTKERGSGFFQYRATFRPCNSHITKHRRGRSGDLSLV
jgi:hypothetical protein